MQIEALEIKTFEQIKQEFLNEYVIQEKTAKPASSADTADAPHEKYQKRDKLKKVRSTGKILDRMSYIPSIWKDLAFLFVKIASIVLVFALLFIFMYGIIRYGEPSMSPMIKDGDLVIFYQYTKSGYLPQDAVVLEFQGQRQVRRVVATEGDTVDITEDGLWINGALQNEPSIYQKTEPYQDGVSFPLTVPPGHVFVLGDSRINATDSRIYGCVKIEDTFGKVMAVIRRRNI